MKMPNKHNIPTLPPVSVAAQGHEALSGSVRLVPGYSGHVRGMKDAFGNSYGATGEKLSQTRSSLFKDTVRRKEGRVAQTRSTAELQSTSWTKMTGGHGPPPKNILDDESPFTTTTRAAFQRADNNTLSKRGNPSGGPNPHIRYTPGYQGHMHQYRESFGGTFGNLTKPLNDKVAPPTATTILKPNEQFGKQGDSKGLQIHTPFTVSLTPRATGDLNRFVRKHPELSESLRRSNSAMPRQGGSGSQQSSRRASLDIFARAGATRRQQQEQQQQRINSARVPTPQKPPTPQPPRTRTMEQMLGSMSPRAMKHQTPRRAKPAEAKVTNAMFNAGRGAKMGMDAESAASSFYKGTRPFGSNFSRYQPPKRTEWGARFEDV
eukprot:TRINITY_DN13760_c0_g1_i1.p1 TRINITY_DN13760_c0_g1~~TRINITY_DN13760_c0_g1_i1.p1  ORF type:complete len:377 (-),score=79.06 TRINITY_DN13760_c0_g1_i1:155-1285(-)